jgi:dTDP-4-dehydrorhamnose 3,5-epimerase-like enzyme
MKKTRLSHIIEIPKIKDEGFLCFAEGENHIPFPIKRLYYIFDVDAGAIRGKHAHKETQQILFCIQGSIKMILDNGKEKEEIILAEPNQGIFLDKMIWHDMVDFKADTILLVVASDYYKETDYIRDYDSFISLIKKV